MTGRFILADLTSHKRGFGVQSAIDAAARQAQNSNPAAKVTWIIPDHLQAAFSHINGTVPCDASADDEIWSEIRRQAEAIKSGSPNSEIYLVTWNTFVSDRAHASGLFSTVTKWFNWLDARRLERQSYPGSQSERPSVTTVTGVLSPEDLERIIIDHLRSSGCLSKETSLYRSKLRPNLRADPRLEGSASSPTFGYVLKNVVDSAVRRKLIGEVAPVPGQERLWLIDQPLPVISSPQVEKVAAPPPGAAVSTLKVPSEPVYTRSAEFRKRLTELGIFCEKRERDILLKSIGIVLASGPLPVSRIRRELPRVAHKGIADSGIECNTDFKRIVNFFLKLMLVSGALRRSDGQPIQRDLGSEAAEVASVAETALDVIELYMLEQVLRKSDVKDNESWQVALALFRQFDNSVEIDGMLDRVAFLTSKLAGRFILTDDGIFECTEAVPAKIVKISPNSPHRLAASASSSL